MRAASLHRFLLNQYALRAAAFSLLLAFVLIALLAFGATGVAASGGPGQGNDWSGPFRWLVLGDG
jgi:hypothetical protein